MCILDDQDQQCRMDKYGKLSKQKKQLALHPGPDPEFENRIAIDGWAVQKRGAFLPVAGGLPQFQLDKIFQEKIFERVFTIPHVCQVKLGDFAFVKRGSIL